ncbi:MAG TPA: DsrE family protein [Puia sp.]|nr:DsrE family protein [Puia sp.]
MNKKKLILFLVIFVPSFSLFAQNQTSSDVKQNQDMPQTKHYIVMEITSNDSLAWKGAMNNIRHLKEKWAADVFIELVAHGPGIELFAKNKTTQQKQMQELKKGGVIFSACANSMKAKNLSKDDIVPEAGIVPSGVVEVITRQEEKWSYLKSGF